MISDRIEVNIAGGLDFPLPRMSTVRQKFEAEKLADIAGAIRQEFKRPEVRAKVISGQVVAVGCGSRGVANIMAYVHEPYAEKYKFTSALPAQLLKTLAPTLQPLLDGGGCSGGATDGGK